MSDSDINKNLLRSLVERISKFTVGIAANENTVVGTGTLIAHGSSRYVLTADHVISGVDVAAIRVWFRPESAIIEKPASKATTVDMGRLTFGHFLPVEEVHHNEEADLALLKINASFELPSPCEYYDISRSLGFKSWPEEALEGRSLIYYGFPVDNSKVILEEGNNRLSFIGSAYSFCNYDTNLNRTLWKRIHSRFFPNRDFLMLYETPEGVLKPSGLSGCGVWVSNTEEGRQIWQPDPILVGVMKQYVKSLSVLIATKAPEIVLDLLETH